jgi:hypothetical protein
VCSVLLFVLLEPAGCGNPRVAVAGLQDPVFPSGKAAVKRITCAHLKRTHANNNVFSYILKTITCCLTSHKKKKKKKKQEPKTDAEKAGNAPYAKVLGTALNTVLIFHSIYLTVISITHSLITHTL